MGMFDWITYEGNQYQTKDTPEQAMAEYEIRGDELWYKECEYKWINDGGPFGWYLKEVSNEWVFMNDFDGLINFYVYKKRPDGTYDDEVWKALFMDGKVLKLEKV